MAIDGTFILADIGGYTGFLTGVGIDHGKEITAHLLNSILKCIRGRWKLANVDSDWLFLYREGREPPDELGEHIRARTSTSPPKRGPFRTAARRAASSRSTSPTSRSSRTSRPIIMMVMKRLVKKDMAGLKAFCEGQP